MRAPLLLTALTLLGCPREQVAHQCGTPTAVSDCLRTADDPGTNNCNACTSRPCCGWCASPVDGASRCMPREGDAPPSACRPGGWRTNTTTCPTPQAPPGGLTEDPPDGGSNSSP